MMRKSRLSVVGLVIGLIVGGTLGIAGVALAGNSPPTNINTCTPVNHHGVYGKPKVVTGSSCPGTKYFQTWNNGSAAQSEINSLQAANTSLSKYKQLLIDSYNANGPTTSYAGVDFSTMSMPVYGANGDGFNFSGANFTNASMTQGDGQTGWGYWQNENFTAANFTGAQLYDGAFADSNFTNANFTNATMNSADFTGATMTGVIYSNTTCPNGSISSDNTTPVAHSCIGQGGGL